MLKGHSKLLMFIIGICCSLLLIVFSQGTLKAQSDSDYLDILGEGGMLIMTGLWLFFLLASRPHGRVTLLLAVGLSCFLMSCMLDLLDEFFSYPDKDFWLYWVESLPASIGMILMSWGLYLWHQEQVKLHQQLSRREAFYREHSLIDYVTQLYSAEYMRTHLAKLNRAGTPYSLAMLDINNFAAFNRQYSHLDGDRLLREVADIIVMNLRHADLACRYAGDRFILVLPDTCERETGEIITQIQTAINHLAFKPSRTGKAVYHKVSAAWQHMLAGSDIEDAIKQVNLKLEQAAN
ncbi:GGDEF domain-containing protein [Gayadomonas joobiniege]|uniref:GGDEF domain-containing protein n=1 Tax=Gayadomonas joobiniege TaxID=1234606 RepID=UPI000375B146|nr:diguanylate cyclase [Gayadomonas joobiniege]